MDNNLLIHQVARRISDKRNELKFRQEDVAKYIGLSRTAYINIEAGRQNITLKKLYCLCQLFGCPFAELLPTVEPLSLTPELLRELAKYPADKSEQAVQALKAILLTTQT